MGRQTREEEAHEAQQRLQHAIEVKRKHKLQNPPPVAASCAALGNAYGVGVGLYFKTIAWVRWLLLWLAICAVPYMVLVNTSRFTTAEYKGQANSPGMSVLPSFNILQSLTFAVLPDDAMDQGVLPWMNIQLPGFEGVFQMPKQKFLVLISFMDAGSMVVFSFACLLLYKMAYRFSKEVDRATMEVADYTVVVKGLPETTPIDIGHHFSRWGRVMDVVMVKDFGPLLHLASTATSLEQQRKAVESRMAHGKKAAKRQQKIKKLEKKMASFMGQANKQLDKEGFDLKAVFVTFNTQSQAEACMAGCHQRWITSWFQRRKDKFLGKYRFWVERAHPPEDMIYENLSVPRLSRYIRMGIVRLVVFAVLLASAGAVTKLMALNMQATRSTAWDNAAMNSMINIDMQVYPLSPTDAMQSAAAEAATLQRIRDAMGDDVAQTVGASFGQQVAYCSVALENACSTGLSSLLGAPLSLSAAAGVTWSNLTDSLLKREAFLQQLPACSQPGSGCTALAMCWPCHCSMLSKVAPAKAAQSDWVLAVKQECGAFIQTVDLHAYVMKGLVSGVLVVLNFVLKAILQLLVEFEKHWTQSDKEHAYAVLAFVSQLLNSVLVLLLVNAQSSIASQAINGALSSNTASRFTSWGSGLILSGAYDDFSPSWYVDVGQSLQLLIVINAVVTGVFALAMWLKRKLHQQLLISCMPSASQAAWNSAWIGLEFVLDARVSDIMLGLWIILMFGSGIPSLYVWGLVWLLVVELTDRWSLARISQAPARYGRNLPFLLLGVLPWAAATHCAFGLWMHTRYKAGHIGEGQISDLASSAGAAAEALASTSYFRRVMQVNGLPLLVLLIVHLGLHVLIRFMLYFCGKACTTVCGCNCQADSGADTEPEVTYEQALLERYAQAGGGAPGSRAQSVCARPGVALAGVPTYRLPHHPKYSEIFSNPLYKPVWFKAFGRLRYTTLVSRPGGGFIIAPEPILDHDDTDMEQSISSMSTDLQAMALHMADNSSLEGTGKHKRRSGLLTDELQAMRERSRSVQVAVLAGLGFDSPRGSYTGSHSPLAGRHKSLDLPFGGTAAATGGSPRPGRTAGGSALWTAPMPGAAAAAAVGGAVGGGGLSLLAAAPAAGAAAVGAGLVGASAAAAAAAAAAMAAAAGATAGAAGVAAGSEGSFSMLAAPGAAGQSRLSSLTALPTEGYEDSTRAYVNAAATTQQGTGPVVFVGPNQAPTPVWAPGPDGVMQPWLPVVLPGGGVGYFPADHMPGGLLQSPTAGPPAGLQAQQDGGLAGYARDGCYQGSQGISLCGGMGLDPSSVQLQIQEQQQQQNTVCTELELQAAAAAAAAAAAGDAGLGGGQQLQYTLRQQAYLPDGPAEPPQQGADAHADAGSIFRGGDGYPSAAGYLPMPPTQQAFGEGSYPDPQSTAALIEDDPSSLEAAASAMAAAAMGQGAALARGLDAAGVGAVAVGPVSLAEPGWMSSSVAGEQGRGFGLWDGVVAAAAAGTAGDQGADTAGATAALSLSQMPPPVALQCNAAGAAAPLAAAAQHSQWQGDSSEHPQQLQGQRGELYPTPLAQPDAQLGMLHDAPPAVPQGPQTAFYPSIHLAFAEPAPTAYPNVHLTTVELPAGLGLPPAAVAAATAATEAAAGTEAAGVDGGSCLSAVLLASTRAEHSTAVTPVFGALEQPVFGALEQPVAAVAEWPVPAVGVQQQVPVTDWVAEAAAAPVGSSTENADSTTAEAAATTAAAGADNTDADHATPAAAASTGGSGAAGNVEPEQQQQQQQPTEATDGAGVSVEMGDAPAKTGDAEVAAAAAAAAMAAAAVAAVVAAENQADGQQLSAQQQQEVGSGDGPMTVAASDMSAGAAPAAVAADTPAAAAAAAVAADITPAAAAGEASTEAEAAAGTGVGLSEQQPAEGDGATQLLLQQQREAPAAATGGSDNPQEEQQVQHHDDSDSDAESCCSPRGVSGTDADASQAAPGGAPGHGAAAAMAAGAAAAGRPASRSQGGGKKKKHKKGKKGRKGH